MFCVVPILLRISNTHRLAFSSTGHRYDALLESMLEWKRRRNQANQEISDSMATTQERVAASLIQSFSHEALCFRIC